MEALRWLVHGLGYGLCHQLPERSFFGGGVQLPVCARDTGIYVGVLLSVLLIAALHKGVRPRGMPTVVGWTAMALMTGAMALDGVTEYVGARTTTNELRLMTGLLAGFAIGALVTPMINEELWRTSSPQRVLDTPWRLAIWLLAVPAAYAVVYWGLPLLGVFYPILVVMAIIGTLAAVNLVIVCTLPPFERRAQKLSQTWAPVLAALAVALFEIWAAALLRLYITTLVSRVLG